MYNLRENNGTFKGIIGECLFKDTDEKVILTKFFSKTKFRDLFQKQISKEKLDFLINNWHSIDALKLDKDNKKIILFEVKIRNKYSKELKFKPKMTLSTHELYNHAKEMGFVVKLATIWLFYNWKYDVEITEFNSSNYYIDKPKKYDKSER